MYVYMFVDSTLCLYSSSKCIEKKPNAKIQIKLNIERCTPDSRLKVHLVHFANVRGRAGEHIDLAHTTQNNIHKQIAREFSCIYLLSSVYFRKLQFLFSFMLFGLLFTIIVIFF